jgi:hypothetical protein
MQESRARYRPRTDAGLAAPKVYHRAELLAIYGALALIAAVVFGTISYHPF